MSTERGRREQIMTLTDRKSIVTDYAGYLLALVTFCGYVSTCDPLVTAGDSGELAASAWTLGINHPPGNPLYLLAGRLASFLPIGTPAFRMAAMSGLFMSLTLMTIYRLQYVMTGARNAAMPFAVLLAAGSIPGIWGQTAHVEVYVTAIFMSVSALYSALLYDYRSDIRYAYLSMFVSGLGLGAHYLVLLVMPAVFMLIIVRKQTHGLARRVLLSVAMFGLGVSVWLYVPLRAAASPPVNWGAPSYLSAFINTIIRGEYGDLGGLASRHDLTFFLAAAAAAAAVVFFVLRYLKTRGGLPADKVIVIIRIFIVVSIVAGVAAMSLPLTLLWSKAATLIGLCGDGGWAWVAAVAAAGGLLMYRYNSAAILPLAAALASMLGAAFISVHTGKRLNMVPLADKFLTPSVVIMMVFAALGVAHFEDRLKIISNKTAYLWYLARILLVSLSVVVYVSAISDNMDRRSYADYDILKGVFNSLPTGSVLVTDGDNPVFISAYLRFVEELRPDVAIYDTGGDIFGYAREAEGYFRRPVRPVFITGRPDLYGEDTVTLDVYGMARGAWFTATGSPWRYYTVRLEDEATVGREFQSRQLAADYLAARGADEVRAGRTEVGTGMLERAVAVAGDQVWTYRAAAGVLMGAGEYGKARDILTASFDVAPLNPDARTMYARCLLEMGDFRQAETQYGLAIKLSPGGSAAYTGLAETMLRRGDREAALELLQQAYDRVDLMEKQAVKDMITIIQRSSVE